MKTITEQIQEMMETVRFMDEEQMSPFESQFHVINKHIYALKQESMKLQSMLSNPNLYNDPKREQYNVLDGEISDMMDFFQRSMLDDDK